MEENKGKLHPITIATNDAIRVFTELGFEVAVGPELEEEWYNFDALNVSKDHPARDMQDTFWIKGQEGKVLRTHTTSATARAIEKANKDGALPAAYVSIGKVFRNESTDATHEMQFFQIDGAMIGENITISNLKAVLLHFYRKMLGEDVDIQLRPSFFPFVEPGLEVWIKFGDRWLEVMGAGLLHPQVLKNLGLDPEKYGGFAFGGGLDRVLMVKHNIPDVRFLYQGDLRINQF